MDSKALYKLDKKSLQDTKSSVKFSHELLRVLLAEIPRENTYGTLQYDSPSDHNTLVFSLRGRQWVTITSATMWCTRDNIA